MLQAEAEFERIKHRRQNRGGGFDAAVPATAPPVAETHEELISRAQAEGFLPPAQ